MGNLGTHIGACPKLEAIILRHEAAHAASDTLPCSRCGIYLADPVPVPHDYDNLAIECPARHRSFTESAALWKSRQQDAHCQEATWTLIDNLMSFLNVWCDEKYRLELPSHYD